MARNDGRQWNDLRTVRITRNYIKHAEGSVLIEVGDTRVICNASIQEGVPPFLKDTGTGWVTAEYSMLPRSTHTRAPRESVRGKLGGRTQEIQRLIGRIFPISGLTATTFFFIFDSSFRIPLICNIGPILVNGLPGAKITSLASWIASIAAGLGLALSAPIY